MLCIFGRIFIVAQKMQSEGIVCLTSLWNFEKYYGTKCH